MYIKTQRDIPSHHQKTGSEAQCIHALHALLRSLLCGRYGRQNRLLFNCRTYENGRQFACHMELNLFIKHVWFQNNSYFNDLLGIVICMGYM